MLFRSENDPDKLVDIICALEPTFGGVNLEDIKAPECFYIEEKLKERMSIPVFHDDQHGTAIISGAAMLNGLKVVGKKIDEIKVVCSDAAWHTTWRACCAAVHAHGHAADQWNACTMHGALSAQRLARSLQRPDSDIWITLPNKQ